MIDTLDGLQETIRNNIIKERKILLLGVVTPFLHKSKAEYFCPKCGYKRPCDIEVIKDCHIKMDDKDNLEFYELPLLLGATCRLCYSKALLLVYESEMGLQLAVLHDTFSGCATQNTPTEVKYYIDQAFRARSVGAVSASAAMYRSALEWILYEQGYQKGMLGEKISKLETDINNKTAKYWAMNIDVEFLKTLRDIGNGAIHTNNGDISKQNEFDKELLECIDIVLSELLDKIYEQPIKSANNLNLLKSKQQNLKK